MPSKSLRFEPESLNKTRMFCYMREAGNKSGYIAYIFAVRCSPCSLYDAMLSGKEGEVTAACRHRETKILITRGAHITGSSTGAVPAVPKTRGADMGLLFFYLSF